MKILCCPTRPGRQIFAFTRYTHRPGLLVHVPVFFSSLYYSEVSAYKSINSSNNFDSAPFQVCVNNNSPNYHVRNIPSFAILCLRTFGDWLELGDIAAGDTHTRARLRTTSTAQTRKQDFGGRSDSGSQIQKEVRGCHPRKNFEKRICDLVHYIASVA